MSIHAYEISVKKVFYSDESSDFYIFSGKDLNDGGKTRKVKGHFHTITPRRGLELKVYGEWQDSQYGPTLVCKKSECLLQSESGVRNYLIVAADMQPYDAHCVMNTYDSPEKALESMRSSDASLYDIEDVSDSKMDHYVSSLSYKESFSDAVEELISFGIPNGMVRQAYEAAKEGDVNSLKDNPYLLMKVDDLSFKKIDSTAMNMGKEPDCQERISAMVLYLLDRAEHEGHLFLTLPTLLWKIERLPSRKGLLSFDRSLEAEDVWNSVKDLESSGRVVQDKKKVYFEHNYSIEHQSAKKISRMLGSHSLGGDVEGFITEFEDVHNITLSDQQRRAIRMLSEEKVFLLTGLPGTGKTLCVKALVRFFQKADKEFDLVCPTGIAAKKLGHVVGETAKTIHRLLGYDGNTWDYGPQTQTYQTDAVIVDESSMLDQDLFYRLVSSLDDDTSLIFVGDPAQLPSVGAGNVLTEMIKSDPIEQVNLTQIFRQGSASDIVLNAHRINEGDELIYNDPKSDETDFKFIERSDPDTIVKGILHFVQKLYDSPENETFQVLSPTYKTDIGVDRLNEDIKSVLNPEDATRYEKKLGSQNFREDDRIMITQNDYEKEVYNGEQGKILRINKDENFIRTKVFNRGDTYKVVDFDFDEAVEKLKLAYAMTCHKSQGQEWDYVIFPFHTKFDFQLQRNLLYTAVTRARKKVFIIGEKSAIRQAVENDRVEQRNTALSERIEDFTREQSD
jgi:exodeoxyribonuclease V alpha subunit